MRYTLPCSPTILRQDRLDLLGSDDDGYVPFWQILEAIIAPGATSSTELIDQLQTIAVTLRDTTGDCDYEFLGNFIRTQEPASTRGERWFFERVWPKLVDLALEMPKLFPECSLPVLSAQQRQVVLSRRQVACLVVHQFLTSLLSQPWETDSFLDFSIWYSSTVRHPNAVRAYLNALFTYFERIVDTNCREDADYPIIFTLRSSGENGCSQSGRPLEESPLLPMTVSCLPSAITSPDFLGLPDGACVISANKNVGFGQSGTQEETQVGSSPECCPIVLFSPTMEDEDVLVVQGPEVMVSLKGYGREVRLDRVLAGKQDGHSRLSWERRTMLFMDALELDHDDVEGGVPDLLPGRVDRELTKAFTAFSSRHDGYSSIVTGLWGCGAFGGNREIKSLIQWCAASMAGIPLHFVCAGSDQSEFATRLEKLVDDGKARSWRVKGVLDVLRELQPGDAHARSVFSYAAESLQG